MKRIFLILVFSLFFGYLSLAQITTSQSITFAVDNVKEPELALSVLGPINGDILAKRLNLKSDKLIDLDTNKWEPKILVNSFSDETGLLELGEDTVFQMLVKAWSQHRPVALSPDVIWMLICQQLSHHINQNPEKYKSLFVSHEGKKEICIQSSTDLYSEDVDWAGIIDGFASTLSLNTTEGVTNSLIANFSTTGVNERLASEITLMDVAKPFFEYKVFYVACGIPYITITGTPEDWKSIIEKARILESIELGWWFKELKPILEQFVMASEGKQDIKFWKNIVKKTRPGTVYGAECGRNTHKPTELDGWFLKLFPFDNKGRTPDKVTVLHTMPRETVVVPFNYQVISSEGTTIRETSLEFVAGIIGIQEDVNTLTLSPKIGWFVRTSKPIY